MLSNRKKLQHGSTLIEVLVAIVIVGLVVTGVMLSITYSIKNSTEARYREVASQLAQDGMEIIKLRREVDQWSVFFSRASSPTPWFYCLPKTTNPTTVLNSHLTDAHTCADNFKNGNKDFTRYVELTKTNGTPQKVTAKVTVEWDSQSNKPMNVEITQEFLERVL